MKANKFFYLLLLPLCMGMMACGGDDGDDPNPTPDTPNNPDIKEEIIQKLMNHKWKGSETEYSEYSYGSSVYTQTWTVYFISDNKGVMHWTAVDKDSSLGTDRSEGDSKFSYSVSGNKIQLYGNSNFCFEYYGDFLMEGETMFSPQSLDSSDKIYLLSFAENYGCPDGNHPHMIDLGLPSGTKWACCNLGENAPAEFGQHYFAWAETTEKNAFVYQNYDFYDEGAWDWYADIWWSDIAGTEYDAATAKWGTPWQMPTQEQFEELISKTSSSELTIDREYGRLFMGKNGNSIFLPAAGYVDDFYVGKHETGYKGQGYIGSYWSSTGYNHAESWVLYFEEGKSVYASKYYADRYVGHPIRPVCQ